jgi:hypothetical protein
MKKYLLIFIVLISLGIWYVANATTSGPNSSGTLASDSTVGDTPWTNPSNAGASDNVYATNSTEGGTPQYLKATNFGFSIPTGATINGILVEVEGKSLTTITINLRIVKGGTIGSTNKTSSLTTTEQYRSVPATDFETDLWGETWTIDDINASTFGMVLAGPFRAGNYLDSVDHIRITVYYTDASGNATTQVRSGTIQVKSGKMIIQ